MLLDNTNIKLISDFVFTAKGIKPTVIVVSRMEASNVDGKLICSKCGDIPAEEIYGLCYECGNNHILDELYKLSGKSGIYCDDCIKVYYEGVKKTPVSKLLKVIISTGEGD